MNLTELTILSKKYQKIRNRSVELCAPLEIEDYIPQAVEFTSPPKWHLAHTTWFFEEMILKKYVENYPIFDKNFSFLFNSYYHTIGERAIRNQRGVMSRPTVSEVYAYRNYVDGFILELLSASCSEELEELMILGINHEQQHQELLITDLKFTLALNPIFPVYKPGYNLVKDTNSEKGWLTISEGVYTIGHQGNDFCFDNELGEHQVFLHDVEISKALVTNGEYLAFIEDGGYENFNYWLDEGWTWRNSNNIHAPLYWLKKEDQWYYFTLEGVQELDKNAILAHISYYEAMAFATWKGCRLPTEFEWEVASSKIQWGKRWEWTNSAYVAYPKFKIAEGAVGEYNGKFMVNQLVLRGGSVATSEGHSRNTYRNFFHPKYQWQFTGIRLAR